MKNANVIPFSPPDGSAPDGVHGPADGSPVSDGTRVLVDAERIVVERLVLVDAGLAGFIAERSPADQASFARARAPDRARRAPGRRCHGQRGCGPARVRRAPGAGPRWPTTRPRARSTSCSARTSPMAMAACRGRSRRSWATGAGSRRSSRSCSTRRSGTARSARCGRCSGRTSTATRRAWPSSSTRPGCTRHSTSSGSRSPTGSPGSTTGSPRSRPPRAHGPRAVTVRCEGGRLRGPARGNAR